MLGNPKINKCALWSQQSIGELTHQNDDFTKGTYSGYVAYGHPFHGNPSTSWMFFFFNPMKMVFKAIPQYTGIIPIFDHRNI